MKESFAALTAAAALAGGCTSTVAESQPFRFYNIVVFAPGREAETAKEIIELRDKTGIDTPLYSLTLHPEGFPAFKKAEQLAGSYRLLKKELEGKNIRLGVLIQSILGHWPRVDKDEEPWTRTVDCKGNTPRFCPLDAGFRKYIWDTVVLLAKEKPSFIMSDDDVRAFSPHVECFCPLHTAEFNKRMGTKFTPKEYRLAICAAKPGDKYLAAFERLRRETVDGVTALIRKAIDSVDPSIPSGTCMPGAERRFNGSAARAMAGKNHPPVMRMANAMYFEGSAKDLPHNVLLTQAQREYFSDIPSVLDEADTCPHNLWSKSARSMHAKLGTSIFCGLNGAKLWYINGSKLGIPVNRSYTQILGRYSRWYQALANAVKNTAYAGVAIPCSGNFPAWHPVNSRRQNFMQENHWAGPLFGMFGIPFYATFDFSKDAIYNLTGAADLERFSDSDLHQMFRHKLIIDGPAAAALTARGFARYMGVAADKRDFRYNQEYMIPGKERLNISKNSECPYFRLLSPKAQIITELYYAPFATSPEREYAAPGTVYFKNELGGEVITTVFHTGLSWNLNNEGRRRWLLAILDKLSHTTFSAADEDSPVTLIHRKTADGDLFEAVNIGYDPMEKLTLRTPDTVKEVLILQPSGKWKKADFEQLGNRCTVSLHLECYESAVLKLR